MSSRSRRPLSLTNLRAFEAVARTLNFGAAAEELHVTQSAISRQIKGLEDELGAQLFVRGTRHVQITPDGQALLRAVEPSLAKLDTSVAAHPPLAQPAARQRHHVRVVRLALAAAAHRGVPARPSGHRHPRLGPRRARRPRRPRARSRAALLQPGAGAGRRHAPLRRDADAGGQPEPLGKDEAGAAPPLATPADLIATRCSRRTTTAPARSS